MKHFYIIAHTHWDREWHKTFQENRVRLIGFMDDLFDTLAQNPDYTSFLLDGQTSLLLDYLEIKPHQQETLANFIREKRIIVGPWYVQPDVNIPSAESLLRNLLISKQIADSYGESMNIGYLPDTFGQSGSLPTLLSSFGIESMVFYRGLSRDDVRHNEFVWTGYDGSQIIAVWLPTGYGNGMFLSSDLQKSVQEVENNLEQLEDYSVSENYLLLSGSDQCYTKKFLPDTCQALENYYREHKKDYKFHLAGLQDYVDAVLPYKEKMDVFYGEMRKGRHSRTHISIAATRMDIKQENYKIDQKYKYILEPLCSLNALFHSNYPRELINRGWRYIVENHAHDSICCCCTDSVHAEMKQRIHMAEQIADTILKEAWDTLHKRIQYASFGRPIIIFSSYLGHREELVTAKVYTKKQDFVLRDTQGTEVPYIIEDIQKINLKDWKVSLSPIPDDFYSEVTIRFYARTTGVGYTTYYLEEGVKPAAYTSSLKAGDNYLENRHIRVEVNSRGALDIIDKKTGITYWDQHILVDRGNAGDEYDYSPPFTDKTISSTGNLVSCEVIEQSPMLASLRLVYQMEVPETSDNQKRSEQMVQLTIETMITLTERGEYLDFETTIYNEAKNHQVQAVFNLGEKADTHFADIQTGEIIRENAHAETRRSIEEGWAERYYPMYTQQDYVAVEGTDGAGWMILNQGLPQYEILQGDTTKVALTLLSSVGMMGNENLKYRPGRRSGAVCATPDSHLLGEQFSNYRLYFTSSADRRCLIGEAYANPVQVYCMPEYQQQGILPDRLTLFASEDFVTLGAFKQAEDGSGTVARFYTPFPKNQGQVRIKVNPSAFTQCSLVNSREEPIASSPITVVTRNNPDGSDKEQFAGELTAENLPPHTIFSVKLSQGRE